MTQEHPVAKELKERVTPWIDVAARSYVLACGKRLFESGADDVLEAAENANFALLMHNGGEDPIFQYANARARSLFGYTLEEFRRLPSRLSAEPDQRDDRAKMLKQAAEKGYFDGYSGVRVSKTGRRFRIVDAVIWQLRNAEGQVIGQAAKIPTVEAIDDA